MLLDELPDLVLHEICLKLKAKDIQSLHDTNRKLYLHVQNNRLHYDKKKVRKMIITNEDGRRTVEVSFKEKDDVKVTVTGLEDEMIKWFNPKRLISYDHDELVNMNPLWWKDIKRIHLFEVIDHRKYLPHFDRCVEISLITEKPMKLSEILEPMKMKNLEWLSVLSEGGLECTDEDFRKIGELSHNMRCLSLAKYSSSTNISNDAILDMIEFGSFFNCAVIEVSQLKRGSLRGCLRRRGWDSDIDFAISPDILIRRPNGLKFFIRECNMSHTMYNYPDF